MHWIFLAVPLAAAQPDLATKNLARCCGTERATLGPLFGKLAIGPLGADDAEMVYVDGLPKSLLRDKVGLKIDLYPGEGQFHTYLDGVSIEVPEHDQCVQLQTRLEKLWGAQAKWVNPKRHQAASLVWTTPSADDPACALVIRRIPSENAAHCLQDEAPVMVREIDAAKHCVRSARPLGCRLDREQAHPTQLDFDKLRACP